MTNRYEDGIRLWRDWTEMWNGRPELALRLVAPRFALHLTLPAGIDAATIDTPEAVERWVRGHRARYHRLTFLGGVGPFVDVTAGIVAGPWHADASIDGTPRPVCGMDTIRFAAGKITEYWTMSKEVDTVGAWSTALVIGQAGGQAAG